MLVPLMRGYQLSAMEVEQIPIEVALVIAYKQHLVAVVPAGHFVRRRAGEDIAGGEKPDHN
jgi:hypothetical protein